MAVDINGDGLIALGGTSATQGRLRLAEDTDNGTNYIELTAPASVTANRTITLPDNTGTMLTSASSITASQLPAGSVLQVVQTIKTDTFSTTSTSLTDITGMSVSITPTSASNKILVSYFLGHIDASDVAITGVALLRGSTKIAFGDAAGNRISTSTGEVTNQNRGVPGSFMFLDSPNTTSSTTYKLQIFTHNATAYVNRTSTDTDTSQYFRAASTITAMEIAG